MKRVRTSLAMCAAALAFMAGVAVPDTASAHDDITRKFCVIVKSGSGDHWITKRDNWVKTRFVVRHCDICVIQQIENIHTENNAHYKTWFKCGPNRTYSQPHHTDSWTASGKVILDWGPDITFNAAESGPYCFLASRVSGNHVNPWKIEQTTGC